MCGILAIYKKYKEDQAYEIQKAYEMLKNRGPDCGSITETTTSIVGFRRLKINDTRVHADQPFVSGDVTVMCNGEIYNHLELEKTFNLKCRSKSDCECILHLYKLFGFKDTINYLDGVFAIVIIDKDKIYFARDRIGIRPLFYGYTKGGNLAIASYARALIGYCNSVYQVKPSIMEYDIETEIVTSTNYLYPTESSSFDLETLLINSVEKRLMADRPIGCMLSGGLDSSLIVSIMCKLIGAENVRTYSIGMEGSTDLKYAKLVADYLGTNHTEVLFTPQEGLDVIPIVIRDTETYDITTIRASVAMWLLSKWISENTSDIVILSGEGSDELFCGYLYFHYAPDTNSLAQESKRLIDNLYLYDALRADRCLSSHGLELRVPFLDKSIVNYCLSLDPQLREPKDGMEKHLLRSTFTDNYLPESVLWRRKEGYSDGVSRLDKSWYEYIQEYAEERVSDAEFVNSKFPTKEAYYYKQIYNSIFQNYQPMYDYWLPKWVEHNGDPSGRILKIFSK